MEKKYNKSLLPYSRSLRKNMTREEKHLWYDFLRTNSYKFVRQKILGKYIADFYCAELNLVIELDGSQHFEKLGLEMDKKRTEYLNDFNITVVRIPNIEINNNFYGVCEYLEKLFLEIKAD